MGKDWLLRLAGVLLRSAASGAAAQEPVAPELRALERYLGSWTCDGEDPLLGGKMTCRVMRSWISGGYESRRSCETPRGTRDEVEAFGFDFETREYTYIGFTRTASMEDGTAKWVGTETSRGNRCTDVCEPDHRSSTEKCETARAPAPSSCAPKGVRKEV